MLNPRFRLYGVLLLLTLLGFKAHSQDWKSVYDKAVSQYQSQQYPEALTNAKEAFALSKKISEVNQAYSVQLITVICIESNQPDDGLKFIPDEVALYQKTEGEKSKTYAEALHKYVLLLQMKGRLKEAETKAEEALIAIKNSVGENDLAHLLLQSKIAELAAANGNLSKAKSILDTSLPKFNQFEDAGEDFLNALSVSANVDKVLKDFPSAEKKYKQLISIYEQNNLQASPEYTSAKNQLTEILLLRNEKIESAQLAKDASLNPELRAQQLLKAAVDFQSQNQLEKAVEQYDQAVSVVQSAKIENNTSFSIYLNYARILLQQKKIPEAEKNINNASQLIQHLSKMGSVEDGFVQIASGDLALLKGNVSAAIETFQKVAVSPVVASSPLLLKSLANSSKKLLNLNQANASLQLLKPIVSNVQNLSQLPQASQEEIILLYCQTLTQSGLIDEAIAQLKEVMKATRSAESKNLFTLELSEALKSKGEWTSALQLLTASDLSSLSSESKGKVFFQIAKLQQQLGNFKEAEKNFNSSLQAYRTMSTGKGEALLEVYNSLAILYSQLGNYDEAERLYLDLLKQSDTFSDLYITIQQNLASVYVETLRYAEAEKLLLTVAEQDKKRFGETSPDYAVTLQNLGSVYQKSGQLLKAKEFYSKALEIDKIKLGDQNLSYATKAANLAVVYQDLNDLVQARALLESTLKIREAKLGKEHPDYVFNEYNLAVLNQRMGEIQKALPLFQHVSMFYIRQVNELFPAMSEKEKTSYFNKINEVILAYQDFVIENASKQKELLGELFNFRLVTKALLLNSSSKVRNRILSSGNAALMQRFGEWIQTKEELSKLYSLNLEERTLNKSKIELLQSKSNESEKWLSSQSELFAESKVETPTWQKIKSKLKPDEAAIEMIRLQLNTANDSIIYAALVLRPNLPEPILVVLPHGKQMEGRKFSFYRNSLRFEIHDQYSHDIFWKPIQSQLKGVTKIYLSPDGVYNKINLLTLFNTESNQYLIDQLAIEQLSNLREMLSPSPVHAMLQSASLFGSPDFKMGGQATASIAKVNSTAYNIIGSGLPELPATKDEVMKIADLLKANQWTIKTYLSVDASEDAVKALENTGVLHIATHGFFIPAGQDDQPIVHSQRLDQAVNNPLLRSGVVLSGAEKFLNSTTESNLEDGILTAYEAMNLNLDKTELVVLSACETGAGEIRNGEGVYGLQRSFLLAGAANILMSLWKVDDEATQELMVEFYTQWNKTKNKATAFHNTQLQMKKKYEAPYYWGSFVMIGTN
jgi:CHAT domain-containing protein